MNIRPAVAAMSRQHSFMRWFRLWRITAAVCLTGTWMQSCPADDVEAVFVPQSEALTEFLRRFDAVEKMGFVRTLRPGSTGVGYTLETLLGIKENNQPQGDLRGMEIKAYRDAELAFDDREKMNLFLKEPEWLDGNTSAERILAYGYQDKTGRRAWYQSVTVSENTTRLRLRANIRQRRIELLRKGQVIAFWPFDVLQKRLNEKLSEAVFVAAETRGQGTAEEFHYQTVTYCAEPRVQQLIQLVESGDVIVELRMHIKPTGGARNHGTAFRLRKHQLSKLFAIQRRCRPVP